MSKPISKAKLKKIANEKWAEVCEWMTPEDIDYWNESRSWILGRKVSLERLIKNQVMYSYSHDCSPTEEFTL